MSLKKFIEVNSKRIIGTSLLLSLMAVQSVGAAGSVSDEIVSKGNIEYDANNDGTADVYFYSNDLKSIATGIDSLNTNIDTLQQSFTDLGNQTAGYKTNIINGLNSNVYAKANIPADSTFEQIIEKINNIPAPTTAVGNVYSSGDNSGLGITANGQSINIDGVTSLNLAVNEAITLPSGYYPNDITIQNNVANRGSLSFSPSAKQSITLQAGYYNGGTLDSTSAYNQGYSDGYAQRAAGTISYIYHHHIASGINIHASDSASTTGSIADSYQSSVSAGCFTKPYYHIKYNETSTAPCYHTNYWVEGVSDDPSQMDTQVYYHCSDCGATAGDQDSNRDVRLTAWRRFQDLPPGTKTVSTPKDYWTYDSTDHPGNRVTTVYTRSCGLTDGQIVSATITF